MLVQNQARRCFGLMGGSGRQQGLALYFPTSSTQPRSQATTVTDHCARPGRPPSSSLLWGHAEYFFT